MSSNSLTKETNETTETTETNETTKRTEDVLQSFFRTGTGEKNQKSGVSRIKERNTLASRELQTNLLDRLDKPNHQKYCTPNQFKTFRLIFGLYLVWHFFSLIPYGPELFGRSGMIPNPYMNPTWATWSKFMPSFLTPETDAGVLGFLHVMVLCSVFFAIGISQNLNSFIVWYGWAFLFNRNNLIANPGLPYVGWLLLACMIIPNPGSFKITFLSLTKLEHIIDYMQYTRPQKKFKDDDLDIDDRSSMSSCQVLNDHQAQKDEEWEIPPLIFWGAWFLMALGYTVSGVHKLQCQSWRDGSALLHVLQSLLSRDNYAVKVTLSLMKTYPMLMKLSSWGSLILEISFLPFGIFDRLRLPYWIAFMTMHIGILGLIDFTDLTLGVMMIHLFTFDRRWLNYLSF